MFVHRIFERKDDELMNLCVYEVFIRASANIIIIDSNHSRTEEKYEKEGET